LSSERPDIFKCVVWDLDHTIWDGVLLEDPEVHLRPSVRNIITTLDQRGIVQSLASKNDLDLALSKLRELGIDEYFLYPQISWNTKSSAIRNIASALNIGLNTFAFVDDEQFEREEVLSNLPEVTCLDAAGLDSILDMPAMMPRFVNSDTPLRRLMYLQDASRQRAEDEFVGPKEEFLKGIGMRFRIERASEQDLQRAQELTIRTNQLNTTGYTYSYEELDSFRESPRHLLLIASLSDRFGDYGRIGLALVDQDSAVWTIKLLLMSCRVMSRGVGSVLLARILHHARSAGVRVQAEFVPNGRNRMMYITYRLANFLEVENRGDVVLLESDASVLPPTPAYVDLDGSEF
jgi:FkbH-like protein